jgi:hypothetical protein
MENTQTLAVPVFPWNSSTVLLCLKVQHSDVEPSDMYVCVVCVCVWERESAHARTHVYIDSSYLCLAFSDEKSHTRTHTRTQSRGYICRHYFQDTRPLKLRKKEIWIEIKLYFNSNFFLPVKTNVTEFLLSCSWCPPWPHRIYIIAYYNM